MGIRDRLANAGRGIVGAAGQAMIDFSGPEEEELVKAGEVPKDPATEEEKSLLFDPFAVIEQLGFREKPTRINYNTLKDMVQKVEILESIIKTRINQVASFAQPSHDRHQLGFRIKLRDSEKEPTKQDKIWIREAEKLVMANGVPDDSRVRNNFEMFLRKFIRDSLTLDQACHPAGTMIETECGVPVAIEELETGSLVRTHTGQLRQVIEKKARSYTGQLIKIRSGGQTVSATAEHPLLAVTDPWFRLSPSRSKGIKPEWVAAKDLKQGHYLVYPKPKFNEREFSFDIFSGKQRKYPNIPYATIAKNVDVHVQTVRAVLCGYYTRNGQISDVIKAEADRLGFERKEIDHPSSVCVDESFARLCGLYLAEGHIYKQKSGRPSGVGFTFHQDEEDLQLHVINVLDDLGITVTRVDYPDRRAVSLIANSANLARFFLEHFDTGSSKKKIPSWIFESSKQVKKAFVTGYLDGDGCINRSTIQFCTISPSLFGGMRVLLADIGVYARMSIESEQMVRGYHHSEKFLASISGEKVRELFGMDPPSRERNAFIQDEDYYYIAIREVVVEEVDDLPVFNMEVEHDNSYVANGYVSHNCFEVIPNRKGTPARWLAVDGSTIRLADMASTYNKKDPDQTIRYVQIYDGIVIAEYTAEELCFGIRNPRTDIRLHGYGVSEVESLVKTVTAMLYGWEYNVAAFRNASILPGILNFKGSIPDKQLKAFRRHWYLSLSGISNAFKTPITNADEMQWLKLKDNNRDMEYSAWYDFLIKVACSGYTIDPVEVNFKYGNTGQKSGLGETDNKEKITESKERGLRPLLSFTAGCMNSHIIQPMNEDFEFAFVGLDAKTRDDVADINKKLVSTTRTIDELRAEDDLEPLPDGLGEIILETNFMQWAQQKAQEKMQAEQAEQGGDDGGGWGDDDGGMPDFTTMFGDDDDDDDEPSKPEKKEKPEKPGKPEKPEKPETVKKSITGRSGRQYVVDLEI